MYHGEKPEFKWFEGDIVERIVQGACYLVAALAVGSFFAWLEQFFK